MEDGEGEADCVSEHMRETEPWGPGGAGEDPGSDLSGQGWGGLGLSWSWRMHGGHDSMGRRVGKRRGCEHSQGDTHNSWVTMSPWLVPAPLRALVSQLIH